MSWGHYTTQVCGDAAVWGDGITPVACAHLSGEALLQFGLYSGIKPDMTVFSAGLVLAFSDPTAKYGVQI